MRTRPVGPTDPGVELPLLINAAAGSMTMERTEELMAAFSSAGVRVSIDVADPPQFTPKLRALVEGGAKAVGIGGGDGTISSAVDILAGTSTILIPVPLGTLNHFATRYGIPTIDATVAALRSGSILTIPIGMVNGHTFVNNASCGFYPHVVLYRERLRRFLTKWPAAVIAALIVFLRRPLLTVDVVAGGQRLSRTTAALWVGIGRHSLRLPAPGDADQNGGVLEVIMPRPLDRPRLFSLAWRMWRKLRRGEKAVDPELEFVRAPEIRLVGKHRIYVAMDGEVSRLAGPLHFEYKVDALNVLSLIVPDDS